MSETEKLPQDETQRILVRTDFDTTFLVEAAAGTGKTSLLIDRIINLIAVKQVSLLKIAAITFTEKAAGELKTRLRARLDKELLKEPMSYVYSTALRELEGMSVGTIHGFCSELIRQRPVEANVEPNFQVADQQAAEILSDKVWEEWIDEELNRDCPPILPFLEMNLKLEHTRDEISLRKLFDEMNKEQDIASRLHIPVCEESEIARQIIEFQSQIIPKVLAYKELCADSTDKYLGELDKIIDWSDAFHSAKNNLTLMLEWLKQFPSINNMVGSKKSWGGQETLNKVRCYRDELTAQTADLLSLHFSRLALPLLSWLKGAAGKYQAVKTDQQILDFYDLLSTARNMLKNSRAARDYFKEKYSYLLVDEFQDTDPLQSEIVFYLAEQRDQFADDWERVNLISGKLFIVGDPKQSIYRFRRADLDLYGKVKTLIEAQRGSVIYITENFRSKPQIIEQVNHIFKPLMTGSIGDRYEPLYVDMIPHVDTPTDTKSVCLLESAVDLSKMKKPEISALEAAHIGEFLLHSLPTGIAYKDCGILFRNSNAASELESALREREIPFQLSGGKTFAKRAEIQTLMTVLAAVDNPYDSNSIVGALRSFFFATDDEELLLHRLNGGNFNYNLQPQIDDSHLSLCFEHLKLLHELKTVKTPSHIIAELFERTDALALLALKPLGDGRVANLLKVLDLARSLEKSQDISFHRFIKWLSELEARSSGEEEAPTIEPTENAVSLMTFHKSKGLEFKLVILYDLQSDSKKIKNKVFINRETEIFDFSLEKTSEKETAGRRTTGFKKVVEEEQSRSDQENLRLLYVAMTRAEQYLILPKFIKKDDSGFWGTLSNIRKSDCGVIDVKNYSLAANTVERLVLDFESTDSALHLQKAAEEYVEWKSNLKSTFELLNRAEQFAKPSNKAEFLPAQTSASDTDSEFSLLFGQAAHRALEMIDTRHQTESDTIAEEAAMEFGLTETAHISDLKQIVRDYLQSKLYSDRVSKADTHYRELEFTALIEDRIIEGKMDLVFQKDDKTVIVDYKTDRVTPETAVKRAEIYREQGRLYKTALEQIIHKPVDEVIFYFLRAKTEISL